MLLKISSPLTNTMPVAELVLDTMLVDTTSARAQTECHRRVFGSHWKRSHLLPGWLTGPSASTSTGLSVSPPLAML